MNWTFVKKWESSRKDPTCGARQQEQQQSKNKEGCGGGDNLAWNAQIYLSQQHHRSPRRGQPQCKCWTFREKITSPGEGADRGKLSRLQ